MASTEYYHSFGAGVDRQVFGGQGSGWFKTGGLRYCAFNQGFGIFAGEICIIDGKNIGQSISVNTAVIYNLRRRGR